jgi:hypothetical protein
MSHYDTTDVNPSLNQDQVRGIMAFLEERLGCFRLFAIDCHGKEMFLINEQSGMEKRALDSFVREVQEDFLDSDAYYEEEDVEDDDERSF